MWFMRPQIHRNTAYSWLAIGPIQIVWNRPNRKPLVWLTTRIPKLLLGRQ